MHGIDRLEERLRRHAAGIYAKRGVIAFIPNKKENVRAVFTGDPRSGQSSRAAADYRDHLASAHPVMKPLRHTPAQALESCRTVTASTLSTFMTSRPIWLLRSREVQKAGVKFAR
jgi:hypothetical protein